MTSHMQFEWTSESETKAAAPLRAHYPFSRGPVSLNDSDSEPSLHTPSHDSSHPSDSSRSSSPLSVTGYESLDSLQTGKTIRFFAPRKVKTRTRATPHSRDLSIRDESESDEESWFRTPRSSFKAGRMLATPISPNNATPSLATTTSTVAKAKTTRNSDLPHHTQLSDDKSINHVDVSRKPISSKPNERVLVLMTHQSMNSLAMVRNAKGLWELPNQECVQGENPLDVAQRITRFHVKRGNLKLLGSSSFNFVESSSRVNSRTLVHAYQVEFDYLRLGGLLRWHTRMVDHSRVIRSSALS